MSSRASGPDAAVLADWRGIPALVRELAANRSAAELDRRADPDVMTIREAVHHLVEANVVAASMVVAALGAPGAVYDWTWLVPDGAWMERLGHATKPVEPSLALLDALVAWVAAQVEPLDGALQRPLRLRDGDAVTPFTVADLLRMQVDHVREHLGEARRQLG